MFHHCFCLPPATGAFLGFANMKARKAFFHSLDKDWGFSPGLQTWSGEDFPVVLYSWSGDNLLGILERDVSVPLLAQKHSWRHKLSWDAIFTVF